MDSHDIRMREFHGAASLTLESVAHFGMRIDSVGEKLERKRPVEIAVVRPPNHADSPLTKRVFKPVTRKDHPARAQRRAARFEVWRLRQSRWRHCSQGNRCR